MTLRQCIAAILVAFCFLGGQAAQAQDSDTVPPCRATEVGRVLDFWLGEWRVTNDDDTQTYGSNSVVWDANGCAIHEYWESANGTRGTSLFYFSINEQTWHQVWVTGDTSQPWGLKHKDLIAFGDGIVQFQGEQEGADGPYLDRTTLVPHPNGTVRQVIEVSTDDGENWRTVFDAVYRPVED